MAEAKLVSISPHYMRTLKLACSKPYGNNVSNRGVQAIIDSSHLSILEHCYATFEVKCSVRVLGQLTRHRHLSFTVKSARGSEFDTFIGSQEAALGNCMIEQYKELINKGVPYEAATYLLPQGVETSLVVTGNFRAWFEYLPKRLCKRAMPEHRELALSIANELKIAAPEIFDRPFMNCANCKERGCDFK